MLEDYQGVRKDIRSLIENKHIEVINYIIKKLVADVTATEESIRNINMFLLDLPQELQILFFKYLSIRRPEEVDNFLAHSEVFEAISDKIIDVISEE